MARTSSKKRERNPVMTAAPTKCHTCGSMDAEVVDTVTMLDTPLLHEGIVYPGRVRRRVRCRQCGYNRLVNTPLDASQVARRQKQG